MRMRRRRRRQLTRRARMWYDVFLGDGLGGSERERGGFFVREITNYFFSPFIVF